MTDLEKAAQVVLDRWDSPAWDWVHQGPTAVLMADLRRALAAHREQAEPVAWVDERAISWLDGRRNKASAHITTGLSAAKSLDRPMALYTAPQQAEPVMRTCSLCGFEREDACEILNCGLRDWGKK